MLKKSDLPRLIVIMGPTAIGKTRVAIELARIFDTEIISADSRQIYRELNVGVARPSPEELSKIPHHLIGFLPASEYYNVSRFESDAMKIIQDLFSRKKCVILAGGSGLYLHAITHGLDSLPDPDPDLRSRLKNLLESDGIEALQKQLLHLDPEMYTRIDRQNPKRLLRALEICLSSGLPASALQTHQARPRPFRIIKIGLDTDRERLYTLINTRVEMMMENGLLKEARRLYPQRDLNALNTVGYKELFSYIEGVYSLEEAVKKIQVNSRRYAKRQLTWFRKDPDIRWFEPDQLTDMVTFISRFSDESQ